MANKSIAQLLADFRAAKQAMDKLTDSMPRLIGAEAVKIVKQNFKLQGYDSGLGIKPWAPRADATNKGYKYGRGKGGKSKFKGSVYNYGNPILMQTRNLYNSLKYFTMGKKVLIGVDLGLIPYAEKMNQGGQGKGFHGSTTHTPPRQFMPTPDQIPNAKILSAIEKKFIFERDKAMKEFKQ